MPMKPWRIFRLIRVPSGSGCFHFFATKQPFIRVPHPLWVVKNFFSRGIAGQFGTAHVGLRRALEIAADETIDEKGDSYEGDTASSVALVECFALRVRGRQRRRRHRPRKTSTI